MADEALNEFVGECAIKIDLVPVLFVHVPGTRNFRMGIAKRERIIGITFQYKPLCILKVDHCKDLASNAKNKGAFVEGEILGSKR